MIRTVQINEVLERPALEALLHAISSVRLGVLGDFTLDGYWYADMRRSQLSRETPLHPRPIFRETYSSGGAANVAWNMAALGLAEVRALTVFGKDWRGEILRRVLEDSGVNTASIQLAEDWITPFYGKIILTSGTIQQEDARLDFINSTELQEGAIRGLLAEAERCLQGAQGLAGLAIADYQSIGCLSQPAANSMLDALIARQAGKLFLVDSRERFARFQRTILKPNDLEAAGLLFAERDPQTVTLAELAAAGAARAQQSGLPFFITLGEQGALVLDGAQALQTAAPRLQPPLDPVGAGDTWLSALSAALAAAASPLQAAAFANLASAVTVRKLHITGTASPAEILALYDEFYG